EYVACGRFINADMIAAELSPSSPETAAIQAGRIMLREIRKQAQQRQDFAFESTLSGKSYVPLLIGFQEQGYFIHISYLWLDNVELSVSRVADRVRKGGHAIPEDVIRRRFLRGLQHFVHDYGPLVDSWILFDNTDAAARVVAFTEARQM